MSTKEDHVSQTSFPVPVPISQDCVPATPTGDAALV